MIIELVCRWKCFTRLKVSVERETGLIFQDEYFIASEKSYENTTHDFGHYTTLLVMGSGGYMGCRCYWVSPH